MKYRVLRTDKAEDQLRDIVFYIASESSDVDLALAYLDKLERSINQLRDFPESGRRPRYSVLKNQGYRVLIVERHLIFYKVNEAERTVIIYAIVDGRRDYLNLI